MKSIILAGGYGTRLKEAGEGLPKGLIAVGETTLVERVVDELRALGISEIALVTNEKYYSHYSRWAGNQKNISLVNDGTTSPETRLGALGDLLLVIQTLGWEDDAILVAPSDTYYEFPLSLFRNMVQKSPNDFATIVRKMDMGDIKNRLGCAILNELNQIVDFVEKPEDPPSPYAAIPFYYYPAQAHALLTQYAAAGNSMDAPGNIIPWLLKRGLPVRACVVDHRTIDVGTPKDRETLKTV
jgi:glucose-1-phosphate thymidylyltransferase